MKIVHKLIAILLFIWSYSMFLSLTDDSNFGSVEYKSKFKDDVKNPRFSLLNIMLGDIVLYIFSYNFKAKKFRFLEFKTLAELFILSDDDMDAIIRRYTEHLQQKTPDDIEIEKEALIYHINNEEQRISKSSEKINLYTTIILTVTPLLLVITDLKQFFILDNLSKVVIVMIAYSILNIILYVFQSTKIQEIRRYKFSDLRASENHSLEINKQYQYNWQFLKRKADSIVSYTKNLQYWIVGLLILSSILAVSSIYDDSLNKFPFAGKEETQKVINIFIDDLNDPYSNSSISVTSLRLRIQKKEVQQVFIIAYDESIADDLVNELKSTFSNLNVKVIADNQLDNKMIKIIEEG